MTERKIASAIRNTVVAKFIDASMDDVFYCPQFGIISNAHYFGFMAISQRPSLGDLSL